MGTVATPAGVLPAGGRNELGGLNQDCAEPRPARTNLAGQLVLAHRRTGATGATGVATQERE